MTKYKDIYISEYNKSKNQNACYAEYKEEINAIYSTYIESKDATISENIYMQLFEKFYDYFYYIRTIGNTKEIDKKKKIKKNNENPEEGLGYYLNVLLDKDKDDRNIIQKALYYYKPEKGDFFTYASGIIENSIKHFKGKNVSFTIIPIDNNDLNKLKDVAKNCGIDIKKGKFDKTEIENLSEGTGFEKVKIKNLLEKIARKEIASITVKNDDGIEIENPGIKTTKDFYETTKQEYQQELQRYFSLVNDLYSFYISKKQNRIIQNLNPILINYYIKKMKDIYSDSFEIRSVLEYFKFYNKDDENIKQIVNYFLETGKIKTQDELAEMLNVTGGSYINRIQKEFEDVLDKAVKLSYISVKTNEEIIEEVAKNI